MSDKLILELGDTLHWDSVIRTDYYATQNSDETYNPIPNKIFSVNGSRFLVGISSETAKPNWRLGGWVSLQLDFKPTTYNPAFPNLVNESPRNSFIRLNRFTQCKFPDYGSVVPKAIQIEFARWLRHVYLEIWEYSGLESDADENKLVQILDAVI